MMYFVLFQPAQTLLDTALFMHVAPRFGAQLLEQVALEHGRERHRAIYGQYYGNESRSWYCPSEVCAEANRKWQPTHDLGEPVVRPRLR
jgi:hypothetical protein